MTMRFLCLQHRQWLSTNSTAAMHTWFQCYEQGLKFEREQRDVLAIPQAGCAMETADLLIQSQRHVERDDITRFTHSVLLLIRLLQRQKHTKQASKIVHQATTSLRQLSAAGIQVQAVQSACEQFAHMTGFVPHWGSQEYRGCAPRQLH